MPQHAVCFNYYCYQITIFYNSSVRIQLEMRISELTNKGHPLEITPRISYPSSEFLNYSESPNNPILTRDSLTYMGRVKRIWHLSPMQAAEVQASLRIRSVSPEPPLLAHTSNHCESWGTFRQKARSLAPLNGWACTVKICHDRMLEDTNSLDTAHMVMVLSKIFISNVKASLLWKIILVITVSI